MATTKHKVQQLVFEQIIYIEMSPDLKKSNNQAHMENGSYEQTVSDLKKELELKGFESPDELQLNTATEQAAQQNPEKTKPSCHQCKKPGYYRNRCR